MCAHCEHSGCPPRGGSECANELGRAHYAGPQETSPNRINYPGKNRSNRCPKNAGSEYDFDTRSITLPVVGSPFMLTVVPGPADSRKMIVSGFIASTVAGSMPLITIQQRDAFGNLAWSADIVSALEAVATSANSAIASRTYRVSSGANDTWTIPIGPLTRAGVWSYDLLWNGVSVWGGARQVVVTPGPVDAGASEATGTAAWGPFEEGQETLDVDAPSLYANSNVRVCPYMLTPD
jgi:hypothetical protein